MYTIKKTTPLNIYLLGSPSNKPRTNASSRERASASPSVKNIRKNSTSLTSAGVIFFQTPVFSVTKIQKLFQQLIGQLYILEALIGRRHDFAGRVFKLRGEEFVRPPG